MKTHYLILIFFLNLLFFQSFSQHKFEMCFSAIQIDISSSGVQPPYGLNGTFYIYNNSASVLTASTTLKIKWPSLVSISGGFNSGSSKNGDTWTLKFDSWNLPGVHASKSFWFGGTINTPALMPPWGILSTGDTIFINWNCLNPYYPKSFNSEPNFFTFDPNCYINSPSQIYIGEAQLREWNTLTSMVIPDNKKKYALAAVVSSSLFNNLCGVALTDPNYAFAQALVESHVGCESDMVTTDPNAKYPLKYESISLQDGCFQIAADGYLQLSQFYPDLFTGALTKAATSGGENFVRGAISKAYYDYTTFEFWEKAKCYDPIGFFKQSCDPYAAVELIAYAYNAGFNGADADVKKVFVDTRSVSVNRCNLIEDMWNAGVHSSGIDYGARIRNNFIQLKNDQVTQPSTSPPGAKMNWDPANYKWYDWYNENISWSDVSSYIDEAIFMFPGSSTTNAKAAAQNAFNQINGGNPIPFMNIGPVMDAFLLTLTVAHPDKGFAATYGSSLNCTSPSISITCYDQICPGETAQLWINFMGVPNFTASIQGPDGKIYSIGPTKESPYILKVKTPGTYKVLSFSDASNSVFLNCHYASGVVETKANISWDKSKVNGGCSTGALKLSLEGNGPWTAVYKKDGGTAQTINIPANTISPYVVESNPSGKQYILTSGGCSNDTINICSVCPTASISGSNSKCPGDSIQLTVDLTGESPWTIYINQNDNFLWKTYSNITQSPFKFYVTIPSKYTVDTVFNANCGAIGTSNATVTDKIAPIANITNVSGTNGFTGKYFNGTNFGFQMLTRVDPLINFNWGSGSPNILINKDNFSVRWTGLIRPAFTDMYTFYCFSDDGVRLWINNQLVIDLWQVHSPYWVSQSIQLNANQLYDLKLEYFESQYNAQVFLEWDSQHQTRQAVPPANNKSITICQGDSVLLNATGGGSYKWNNPSASTKSSVYVSPTDSTFYTVSVTGSNSCIGTDVIKVKVNQLPVIQSGEPYKICKDNTIELNPTTGNYTYLWTTTEGTLNNANIRNPNAGLLNKNISLDKNVIFNLNVTDKTTGCKNKTSAVVTFESQCKPIVTVKANRTSLCIGDTTQVSVSVINAYPINSYQWSNPAWSGSAPYTVTLNTFGNSKYVVTVTDNKGRQGIDSVTIAVHNTPSVDLGSDRNICKNDTLILSESGGNAIKWLWNSNSQTTQSIKVSPNQTTYYTVTIWDNNGCTNKDSINVIWHDLPSIDAGGPYKTCKNRTIELNPTIAGYTYHWTPTEGKLDNINIRNPNAGLLNTNITINKVVAFQLDVIDQTTNCKNETTANVTFEYDCAPEIKLKTSTSEICQKQSTVITDTVITSKGIQSFQWSDVSLHTLYGPFIVSPSITTTYFLTVTDNDGKSAVDSVIVKVNSLPVPEAGNNFSLCEGKDTIISATGGKSYIWNTGVQKNLLPVKTIVNTTYTVTVFDNNNCSASDSVIVQINKNPTLQVSSDTTVCAGSSVTLLANSDADKLIWNNGSTTSVSPVTPDISSTYLVTATSTNSGCSIFGSIVITTIPPPPLPIVSDTVVCSTSNNIILHILNSSSDYQYEWYDGPVSGNLLFSGIDYKKQNINLTDTLFVETSSINKKCKSLSRGTGIMRFGTPPTADFSYSPLEVRENMKVNFTNLSTTNIQDNTMKTFWTFDEGSFSNEINPTYSFSDTGKYEIKLKVTNADGCSDQKIYPLIVLKQLKIWLPDAFTPNKDSRNDFLWVRGPVNTLHFEIFNQWGFKIFETDNQVEGWDGTYKGVEQPEGNYIWKLRAVTLDGISIFDHGNIFLIR